MNFVEVHLNDYAAATFHLSPLEDGIYWRLLRCYYRDEQPLPVEIKDVARMAGARTDEEIRAVEVVLKEFFSLESDGWRQARCDEEIERIAGKREKAREAAAASWEKRRSKADAMQTHSDRNATHSPTLPLSHSESIGALESEFEQDIKPWYPKRAGGYNWPKALKAYIARRKEGHSVEEIQAGTVRYAKFCEATKAAGTQYVKQAVTFYGPDKHFLEAWEIPDATDRNLSPTDRVRRANGLG